MSKIHKLGLFEVYSVTKKLRFIRVPNGWICERVIKKLSDTESEVIALFIPYSDEFNEDVQGN